MRSQTNNMRLQTFCMDEQTYWRDILAINSANLASNLEVLNINSEMQRH